MFSTCTTPPPVVLTATAATLILAFCMPASASTASIAWRVTPWPSTSWTRPTATSLLSRSPRTGRDQQERQEEDD